MKKHLFKIVLTLFTAAIFLSVHPADAAILELSLDENGARIGDTITVDLRVDSEGVSINAAEAVLQFPAGVLEATSISREDSIFNFWLEDPKFSNEDGRISFVGGTSAGFSGASLKILTIRFKVIGSGLAEISFLEGAVAANDGSGTNVLSEMRGLSLQVSPVSTTVPGAISPPAPPIIPPPTQIERPAVPTGRLPSTPELSVPLYPNADSWYNLRARFSATWSLPDDITDVDTLINQNPSSNPATSEGLFDSKSFPALDEGIWYLHVRFKNDRGWGPTAHYKIALDTTPPIAFNVDIDTGETSDNPTPTLSYRSGDNLSGLKHYSIRILGQEAALVSEEIYKFEPLKPQSYDLVIGAIDNAGNSTDQRVVVQVIPLEPPVITLVSKEVVIGEDDIVISGTSLPGEKVELTVRSVGGGIVAGKIIDVGDTGNWSGAFSDPLRRGMYVISVKTVDSRGAESLPIDSSEIRLKDKPLLTIVGIDITATWFFFLLALLMGGAFGLGFLYQNKLSKERSRDMFIARRDITNAFNNIVEGVDKILAKYADNKIDDREAFEIRSILKRMKEGATKAAKYIGEYIEEIKK